MKIRVWLALLAIVEVPVQGACAETEAFDKGWLKLLHYEKNGSGYESVVENGEFFLTSGGRENPEAEYRAAVTAFNAEAKLSGEEIKAFGKEAKASGKEENSGELKKCAFPARFIYLKRQGAVRGTLDGCASYQKFLADVQPKAVTMLFTNAYMSNPSSLFGHTLFRIDTKRKGTQLLAHGANFGADTGDETGVLYALKGLWGGYYGTFGIKPYYDVINLYNNIENRDIWEYELRLSDDELELFTAHMWEMQRAKIRYYFASRNCSYVLLLMLEAARPELDISGGFGGYTVPLATLKAVNNVSGLVTAANYRPSRQSKLKYRAAQMNSRQYDAFIDIIRRDKTDLSALDEEEKADVLETAYQYVQYRYVDGDLELADYRKKSLALLRERSKIANQRQYFDELKEGENPVLAHKAKQAGITFGARNGEAFQEVSFKPVYNSLLEDSYGLLNGAEINLFEGKVRHYDARDKWVLQELNLLGIKSLAGADAMFSPLSYDIKVGYRELFDAKSDEDSGALVLETGVGQSYALGEHTLLYAMSVPNAAYGGGLYDNGYLGIGLKGGVYYNSGRVRLNLQAMQNFTTSDTARGQTYAAEGGYGLTRDVMLYAGYKKFNSYYHDDEEFGLGIKVNF